MADFTRDNLTAIWAQLRQLEGRADDGAVIVRPIAPCAAIQLASSRNVVRSPGVPWR